MAWIAFVDGPTCANMSRETRIPGRKRRARCPVCRWENGPRQPRRCAVHRIRICIGICRHCYDRDGSVVHLGPLVR